MFQLVFLKINNGYKDRFIGASVNDIGACVSFYVCLK
jgi:hypothetical protein